MQYQEVFHQAVGGSHVLPIGVWVDPRFTRLFKNGLALVRFSNCTDHFSGGSQAQEKLVVAVSVISTLIKPCFCFGRLKKRRTTRVLEAGWIHQYRSG